MHIFHCDHCGQLLFFENTQCVHCKHQVAYLPDLEIVGSLDPVDGEHWRSPLPRAAGKTYRLCRNYQQENVCNWTVAADDPNPLCLSCRLTSVVPDLNVPGHRAAWYRLEVAKRRLVYTLLSLGLPLAAKSEGSPDGLAFRFLADAKTPDALPVLTGHADGVITVNIAEA